VRCGGFFLIYKEEMDTVLDDSILYENVGGVTIDEISGEWSFNEFKNADDFLMEFGKYEDSIEAL
jgi:hypothetical protein